MRLYRLIGGVETPRVHDCEWNTSIARRVHISFLVASSAYPLMRMCDQHTVYRDYACTMCGRIKGTTPHPDTGECFPIASTVVYYALLCS